MAGLAHLTQTRLAPDGTFLSLRRRLCVFVARGFSRRAVQRDRYTRVEEDGIGERELP